MNRKTKKAGAAVGSVSPKELDSIIQKQVLTIHEEEAKAEEKQTKGAEDRSQSHEAKEPTDAPIIPGISALDESIQKSNRQLVNCTRNLFGDKDDKALFAADKKFVSSLIAEICYSNNGSLDETSQKAKDQIYDSTFKKLEHADPWELYEDVCSILEISHDYTRSMHENNPSVMFQSAIDDIIHKYALIDIDKVASLESVDDAAMLKIDSGNIQEELAENPSASAPPSD